MRASHARLVALVGLGLSFVACAGDSGDDLFGPPGATGDAGQSASGGTSATGKGGSGGSTSGKGGSTSKGGSGGTSAAGTGGSGDAGTGGSGDAGTGGSGDAGTGGAAAAGSGGTGVAGTGGSAGSGGSGVAGSGGSAGSGGTGVAGAGGTGAGGAGGAGGTGVAGTGGSGGTGVAGTGGTGTGGAGGSGGTGVAGTGGTGTGGAGSGGTGAGAGGSAGTGGGSTNEVTTVGIRKDSDAFDFWVTPTHLTWLGIVAEQAVHTPILFDRAGSTPTSVPTQGTYDIRSLVPNTDKSGIVFDAQIPSTLPGQTTSAVGLYGFQGSIAAGATSNWPIQRVTSSSKDYCWAQREYGTKDRLVCRSRSGSPPVPSTQTFATISSIAATTKWVYFTQNNTLMRWDRSSAQAANVAVNIQRVKVIGDVIWAVAVNGHTVRVADGDSTVDYGPTFDGTGVSALSFGVTDKQMYVSMSYPSTIGKPSQIVRVDEAEGEVSLVLADACNETIAGVGVLDKDMYYLCGEEIRHMTLP